MAEVGEKTPANSGLLGESQCGCKEADNKKGDDEVSYHCDHVVLCTGLTALNPIFGDDEHVLSLSNAVSSHPISRDCDNFSRC